MKLVTHARLPAMREMAIRRVTYRCPSCGLKSWYVRGADRFFHADGSENQTCLRILHLGRNPWAVPTIIAEQTP